MVTYDKGNYAFETATMVPQTNYRHDKSLSEFETDVSYWVKAYTMDEDMRYEQYILAMRFTTDIMKFMGDHRGHLAGRDARMAGGKRCRDASGG